MDRASLRTPCIAVSNHHVGRSFCDAVYCRLDVTGDQNGHYAGVNDAKILCTIYFQPSVDDATLWAWKHCTCADRVKYGQCCVEDKVPPLAVIIGGGHGGQSGLVLGNPDVGHGSCVGNLAHVLDGSDCSLHVVLVGQIVRAQRRGWC